MLTLNTMTPSESTILTTNASPQSKPSSISYCVFPIATQFTEFYIHLLDMRWNILTVISPPPLSRPSLITDTTHWNRVLQWEPALGSSK